MDITDTGLLIYHDEVLQEVKGKKRDEEEEDEEEEEKKEKRDAFQEFMDKVRSYNKQGPHYIYSERSDYDRKIKDPRRLIRKSGKYNVSRSEESQIWDKYLRDFSNTLVHSRWRWIVITASSCFILSWLIFAVIWMLISNANGDWEIKDNRFKCLVGIESFAGFFMFSLETQTTIGYGSRSISDHCPEGVFIICLQIILGVAICGLMVNIVYIKMTKPKYHYSKLFSKHAIICRRDGDLCLMFRVRDEDSRHAIGTTITAYVLRKDKETGEPFLETLPLEPYGFLIWPLEIVHKITSASPLWDVSSYNLLSDKFEIIVTLQGTSPTTAHCSRTRTSYISSEILWGHKFKNCVKFMKKENSYFVNQKNFNITEEYATHLCSAKRFAEVYSTISPVPSKNLRFKLNIHYNGSQRRGTLMSIESIESASKSEEQIDFLKIVNEKSNQHQTDDKTKDSNQNLERPSTPTPATSSGNFFNQNTITPAKRVDNNVFQYDFVDNFQDPYEKQWEYQSYSGSAMPDFYLKGATSLPVISDYDQNSVLNSRQFGSDIQNLRPNEASSNLSESKGLGNCNSIFEGEEYVFETSAEESNMSLFSVDYPRSDADMETTTDLDAMLKSMESYLELNSDSESNSTAFPKA